jgi:signal transduction histidine kinase
MLSLLVSWTMVSAQQSEKSELQQRAEEEASKGKIPNARSLYIKAWADYANKGQTRKGVECGVKATALYYKENLYKEAFEFLHRVETTIVNARLAPSESATLRYMTTKERMQMYTKLRKSAIAQDYLNTMETLAAQSSDEGIKNDLLYSKAIYYYTFGMNAQGNAVFKQMAQKLTADKEYDKVDEAYKTLIANGRRSNSANLVAQSYSSYIAWKDSVDAIKVADEIGALKQQIADNEATIADKDSSLTTRQVIIVGLGILAAALAAALVVGAIILMRFILLTRKQKKAIDEARETNALKAKFISNISAQLAPTLQKLDSRQPEVKALQDFSAHIQTLSQLENSTEPVELTNTQIPSFCEQLVDEARSTMKKGINVTVTAPKMSAEINKEYVSHILLHLLGNAAVYTPAGGSIQLEFKKRGPRSFQFLVSDTGEGIAAEHRDDIFKPFLEIRDLTQGDGLGLPICRQMAQKMNGDLYVDAQYTKGARFVLELHS